MEPEGCVGFDAHRGVTMSFTHAFLQRLRSTALACMNRLERPDRVYSESIPSSLSLLMPKRFVISAPVTAAIPPKPVEETDSVYLVTEHNWMDA